MDEPDTEPDEQEVELPPAPQQEELSGISERLQRYNQKIQEQAFLLGYRNGFREGEMARGLVRVAQEKQREAERESTRQAWQAVEHWLVQNGAFLESDQGAEITYPPGLNLYLGAFEGTPMIQVAGERIAVDDFQMNWEPAPSGRPHDGFNPAAESGKIRVDLRLNLPEDSEERQALMEFLEGVRDQ